MIKAAVIGCGFIGPAHVEALRRINGVKVVAIGGSCKEKAEEASKKLGIPVGTGDYRELLTDHEIDVFHVCTPNNLHYQMVKDILNSGKHVVCEKPLALDSEQGRELYELAGKSGLVNAVCFNYRFYPMIVEARERIKKGDLGRIFIVHGSYLQDWLLYKADYNWRLVPGIGGKMRAVADIGSHWADLASNIT
ncbi:MAG: Gfo/Idh/MocA family oxidoreductase, partial [Candidatus Eremiobacteraeota bacterium]|nr:Gfo/Idh/MocA family oxidoreductase [Candidatus Eremiobacteraeota bacterium]